MGNFSWILTLLSSMSAVFLVLSVSYLYIFQKTEVQMVILKFLMGPTLNWLKLVTQNPNISISCLMQFCKSKSFAFFAFFNQLRFRPVQHLKMMIWTSFVWKIYLLSQKWPEKVGKQQLGQAGGVVTTRGDDSCISYPWVSLVKVYYQWKLKMTRL